MSNAVVSPFLSMLKTLPDCVETIYTRICDDRTLRMISCSVQSSKFLRDNITLKKLLCDLKSLHEMRISARDVLEVHLRTPLLDNSVLDEFITSKTASEMSRFHLLHAIRTHCAGILCNDGLPTDFKKIETNVHIEGILREHDCILLLADMHKCIFSPEYSMYLFECIAYAQSNFKYEEFQNTHAPSRTAQWEPGPHTMHALAL